MATPINDRIDVRISKEQKELIKFASELKGFKSLTEFVVFCINNEANRIIIENNQILKSIEDKKVFLNALLNPPKPNNKLKKAQLNYLKFIESNGPKNSTT
ncbi:type II toxin-antitoxin system TacA family antitoxin [Sphingobacterium lactis]|uniref:Uncharacterized conserved protein, DUF1778 family n=1 Tax=Sphingobacterium lactis TaxID=797291 RepID=A0A1H5SC29_9SPHI|nr:DUF1778 domain-containing protein [Sphingobacterium lactis]SEF47964.1 Uncharacterized conserved protein, DUF1778 family [Sphingobacterium lactis]